MLWESHSIGIETCDRVATLWMSADPNGTTGWNDSLAQDWEAALAELEARPHLDVVILRTRNGGPWVATADPESLLALSTEPLMQQWVARGQAICDRLARLPMRTLALLEGGCTGLGLELALACDYRLGVTGPDAGFGFPGVSSLQLPVWGGLPRLAHFVGLNRALQLAQSGERISPRDAEKIGLIHEVVAARRAAIHLRTVSDSLQDRKGRLRLQWRTWQKSWEDRMSWMRRKSCQSALRSGQSTLASSAAMRAAICEILLRSAESPVDGQIAERNAFAKLLPMAESQSGLQLAVAAEQPLKPVAELVNPLPNLPMQVGVVGGGEHGCEIALWLAFQGREVILHELTAEAIQAADRRLQRSLERRVQSGWMTPLELTQIRQRIQTTITWNGFDSLTWVIEAVDEDTGVKMTVLQELEERCKPRTILASTTSTLKLEPMQSEMRRPGRFIGIHWPRSPLQAPVAELVAAPLTDRGTFATVHHWLRGLGQLPVAVSDLPGRIVQRLMLAGWSEAVILVSEGLPIAKVDALLRDYGVTMGPLSQLDEFGLERIAQLAEQMQHARGDRFAAALAMRPLRELGMLGRSSGAGFFEYENGTQGFSNDLAQMALWRDNEEDTISGYVFDPVQVLQDAQKRLLARVVNEAAQCLSEELIASPLTLDLVVVRATGWAAPQGGPLRLVDQLGVGGFVDQLHDLAKRYGSRFEPALELQRRAEANESFYGTESTVPTVPTIPLRQAG
ncbi:3-hydroxyacyl-CoA dehydrogenase NAD-binding domain-containing protein [Tuwongella immobilis]|uniref:Uncharacterized protein n=1 Tax=Tuwongella immobilis TaxID=692036 RepID=A0A6C2YN53_9BACT|nr:3-hydroxyacyl-CoA dehydrogenase NAD-binding domain-containing protein [Tuwongella immobilis]VIP02807.1 multifunctional fatty acid oxidation complex subunit alpha : 3-hydroxybutyryl-CoA epimerase OS=Planctomyces brasiliensis (strain ATCC 49424 / DSM 5305 / JCM 21570 / NBRC 103401 / IFAM 1448) GN=Plabr_2886 PE=3 SV=1: ECH: 3HCDH_N: 3HCDH [Tuwongella immobilis]VTS02509.1 multifunctional fatty acid oxidation complex subunit alpha : 3-hydroxybutyryl-CoA epimerase OS=Planctomyces brasiliensis (strai